VTLSPGALLGPYEIESPLGAGGMGEVYRARDTRLGRSVAIKLLRASFADHPKRRQRFHIEARAIASLQHPHICTLFDVGEDDGQVFLVLEYLEGETLADRFTHGPLAANDVLRYASQIASALDHAHRARIVHRDLKPSNVMLTESGAKLLDFGLARAPALASALLSTLSFPQHQLTGEGTIVGTFQYLAPEQLDGRKSDERTDIFAFGTLLYEMATGTRAFEGTSQASLIASILTGQPASVSYARAERCSDILPAALDHVVERCLAKKPDERWQTARDVMLELDWITKGRPSPSLSGADRQTVSAHRSRLSSGGPPSANREANRLFENAMQLKVNFDLARGRAMLERALELDPDFAEARAWHAFTHWIALDAGFSNDNALLYESEEDLRRALRTDASLPRAHVTFAAIYFMQGRKELMIAELRQALKADPRAEDADLLHFLMQYHHYNGEYGMAQDVGQRVVEHLPLFFPARMILGDMLRQQGDVAGAVREQENILEQDPQNIYAIRFLARACMDASDLQRARHTLERARPDDRQSHWTRLMWAMLLALEDQAPKEVDDDVLRWGGLVAYMTYDIAALYAARGDVSGALEWLDRAVRSGDERAEYFRRDPLLGPVRNQPRFRQIVESIEYRRKHRHVQ
jgi:serine/threonine protein kinase